jgi:hypothetical protein
MMNYQKELHALSVKEEILLLSDILIDKERKLKLN